MIRKTAVSFPGIGLAETIDGVARTDDDLAVVAVGDPGQHRHRFALAAGDDVDDFVVR